jgi:hypothetical protein
VARDDKRDSEPPPRPLDPAPVPAGGSPGGAIADAENLHAIRGKVRGFQSRTETSGGGGNRPAVTHTVWTFRLITFDDSGNELRPIPVEMRAVSFEGFLNDGDDIEIAGKWRAGSTAGAMLQPEEVYNHDTQSWIRVKTVKISKAVKAFLFVVIIFFGSMLLVGIYAAIRTM